MISVRLETVCANSMPVIPGIWISRKIRSTECSSINRAADTALLNMLSKQSSLFSSTSISIASRARGSSSIIIQFISSALNLLHICLLFRTLPANSDRYIRVRADVGCLLGRFRLHGSCLLLWQAWSFHTGIPIDYHQL